MKQRIEILYDINAAAIEVHDILGPGMLEYVYERALKYELELRGHRVVEQQKVPIIYKGVNLVNFDSDTYPLRTDLIVDDTIVIELKSVEALLPVHFKQLTTYLKLLNLNVGVLYNFNVQRLMKDGFGKVDLSANN